MKLIHIIYLIIWLTSSIWGFGKNKVQFSRFHWQTLTTTHFDIYYPKGDEKVGQFTAQKVEEIYSDLSHKLNYKLRNRIPILVHGNHIDFEQTNIIPFTLSDGIGGFTTVIKNQVVLPFEGNYKKFYQVLKHELVHAMLNNLKKTFRLSYRFRFPLWANEGLAEYLTLGWNTESESYLISSILSNSVPSPYQGLPGFLAYKGGQNFWHFIATQYNKEIIPQIFKQTTLLASKKKSANSNNQTFNNSFENFNNAFKEITEIELSEMGDIWLKQLKKSYWTELQKRQYTYEVAQNITQNREEFSWYHLQPIISPNSKKIAFFSYQSNREGLYILDIQTKKIKNLLLESGVNANKESFHSFKSKISWNSKSNQLIVVSKKLGRDVLYIIDANKGDILKEIDIGNGEIRSPHWSYNDQFIVFNWIKQGSSNLYLYHITSKKLTALTQDIFMNDNPVFSPSGQWIYFQSNRPLKKNLKKNPYGDKVFHIYRIHTSNLQIEPVVTSPYHDEKPSFGAHDSILIFRSNRSGIFNLYLKKLAQPEKPITNLISTVNFPSISRDSNPQITFTSFENNILDIFVMKNYRKHIKSKPLPLTQSLQSRLNNKSMFDPIQITELSSYKADSSKLTIDQDFQGILNIIPQDTTIFTVDSNLSKQPQKYYPKFSIDYTGFGISGSPSSNGVGNIGGGGVLSFSDLTGDHNFIINLLVRGDINNSSLGFVYNYLPYKWDYSLGFYYYGTNDNQFSQSEEKYYIGLLNVALPFSVFSRLNFNTYYNYLQIKGSTLNETTQIINSSLYWSFDNVQYGLTGPFNGQRWIITNSLTPPINNQHSFGLSEADFRNYFVFGKFFTWAVRANFGRSYKLFNKKNPHRFYLGGDAPITLGGILVNTKNFPENSIHSRLFQDLAVPLRGFPYLNFKGNKKILFNTELRFPLPIIPRIFTSSIFADYGSVWTTPKEFKNSHGLGIGYGFRTNLSGWVIRWTRAWGVSWVGNQTGRRIDYLSIGSEF